jgi:hypothetical protein
MEVARAIVHGKWSERAEHKEDEAGGVGHEIG